MAVFSELRRGHWFAFSAGHAGWAITLFTSIVHLLNDVQQTSSILSSVEGVRKIWKWKIFCRTSWKHLKSGRAPQKEALATTGWIGVFFPLWTVPPPPASLKRCHKRCSFQYLYILKKVTAIIQRLKGCTPNKKRAHFLVFKKKGGGTPCPRPEVEVQIS